MNRSTLAHWTGYAAGELKPLWEHIRSRLLTAPRLFVDETKAPVLDPGRGRTKSGYFWAVAQDQRDGLAPIHLPWPIPMRLDAVPITR